MNTNYSNKKTTKYIFHEYNYPQNEHKKAKKKGSNNSEIEKTVLVASKKPYHSAFTPFNDNKPEKISQNQSCNTDKITQIFENSPLNPSQFQDLSFEGVAEASYTNGTIYKGSFINGVPHGIGMEKKKDGEEYIGEFRNGEKFGTGTISTPNTLYMGDVRHGIPHGYGLHINAEGVGYNGKWSDGLPDEQCKIIYPTGIVKIGTFSKGTAEGKWKITHLDGTVETGIYSQGRAEGKWKVTHPDGIVKIGTFSQGRTQGKWKTIYPNGIVKS